MIFNHFHIIFIYNLRESELDDHMISPTLSLLQRLGKRQGLREAASPADPNGADSGRPKGLSRIWLLVFLEHDFYILLFSHILGMIIPIDSYSSGIKPPTSEGLSQMDFMITVNMIKRQISIEFRARSAMSCDRLYYSGRLLTKIANITVLPSIIGERSSPKRNDHTTKCNIMFMN